MQNRQESTPSAHSYSCLAPGCRASAVRWSAVFLLLLAFSVVAAPAFPLKYSADKRYLVDQADVPFPILGRTAWFVLSLPDADYRTFVEDTIARGFNAVELHVLNHDPRGNHPPFDGNGNAPFLKTLDGSTWSGELSYIDIQRNTPNFTTPNEAYWEFVDAFLAYCEANGVLVLMFPAYVGYEGGDQGWMQEMVANGTARMRAYGNWIADRYRDRGNLVWMLGGDMQVFDSRQQAIESALLDGLESVPRQLSTLFSAEWSSNSLATDQPTFRMAITLNGVYAGFGDVAIHGRRAYASRPVMPAFLLEEPYDEEGADGNGVNGSAIQPVRRFQWWGWLSTIGGYVAGNGYVWPFRTSLPSSRARGISGKISASGSFSTAAPSTWIVHLDTQGSRDMARLNAFIRSIAWHALVPSGPGELGALIKQGGSSPIARDFVSAAAAPDGSLAVAYVPPAHNGPIGLDMTRMRGPTRARWFDPTSGEYRAAERDLINNGICMFRPPGKNSAGDRDWVLVLDVDSG